MRLVTRHLFTRADTSVLLLGEQAVSAMRIHRQLRDTDAEAGGVLLGRLLLECPHAIVDEVTVPVRGDRRHRFWFRRSRRRHQDVVTRRWMESGGTCLYLGEWHTHPEADPAPSSTDERDWRRRLAHDTFDTDSLFFVIVGTLQICAWEGYRDGRLVRLGNATEVLR